MVKSFGEEYAIVTSRLSNQQIKDGYSVSTSPLSPVLVTIIVITVHSKQILNCRSILDKNVIPRDLIDHPIDKCIEYGLYCGSVENHPAQKKSVPVRRRKPQAGNFYIDFLSVSVSRLESGK